MSFKALMNVLPPAQRELWPELQAIGDQFVLYGGSAIALRLGHRSSIDFDFFSSEDLNVDRLYAGIFAEWGATANKWSRVSRELV